VTSGSCGIVLAVVAAGIALAPGVLLAQAAPLVVEVRAGAALPVSALAAGTAPGEGVKAGPSFGVDFAMSGQGRRTVYAGFSQHRFACAGAGCPSGDSYVATSLDVGFRFSLVTRGPVIPWIRLGGTTLRMETPALPDGPAGVSDRGYGGEVGMGVYVGAWSSVALNPGVRFTTASTRLPGGDDLTLRFVVADLGLSLAF
jgi:hypothetical protein